nr:hypothetical protein [uncultured Gellertiella sp.]
MADPAVARERFFSLRETIARMEGKPVHALAGEEARVSGRRQDRAFLPFGIDALDAALDGGLPRSGMAEIRSGEMRNAGAATGLALALGAFLLAQDEAEERPVNLFWIGERSVCREAGEPLAEGLEEYGLPRARLVYALPRRLEDALWLAEAALASRAFRAVILEIAGNPVRFGLSESRRLSLRARHAGSLLLLLRQGGGEEAGSTLFRLQAGPAPSGLHLMPDGSALRGTIGAAAFTLTLEKSPKPASPAFSLAPILEWNADERLFRPQQPVASLLRSPDPAHPVAGLSPPCDGPDRAPALGAVVAFSRAS